MGLGLVRAKLSVPARAPLGVGLTFSEAWQRTSCRAYVMGTRRAPGECARDKVGKACVATRTNAMFSYKLRVGDEMADVLCVKEDAMSLMRCVGLVRK